VDGVGGSSPSARTMNTEQKPRPLVAVGIIILNKEGKVLVGERLSSHGAGTYQIPGGHFEFGKTFEQQARDEVREETGITDIQFKKVVSVNNERVYGRHYVNIGFLAEWKDGEPGNPEPEKSRNWQWYDPTHLPQPMFPPSEGVINAWLSNSFTNEITA
jgi:8-oxo-dGTP diphosphatase